MNRNRHSTLCSGTRAVAALRAIKHRRRWVFALKLLLTLVMLVAILLNVDWLEAGERLSSASAWLLAAALATLSLSLVVAAFRWSLIARQHQMTLQPSRAVRLTLAAQFLGQALPSTVGVDAVRSWLAMRLGLPVLGVVASVIVDRLCGLVGLSILILVGLPRLLTLTGVESNVLVALAAVLVIAAAAGGVPLFLLMGRTRLRGSMERVRSTLVASAQAMTSTNGMWAIAWSVIIQVLVVLSVVLIAWSVELPLDLIDGFATVPAAMLVAVIPITINGWGLREGAMITAMGLAGISPAEAVVVSVLFGVILFLAALPGALAWLSFRGPPEAMV